MKHSKPCENCGAKIDNPLSTQKYCSESCRFYSKVWPEPNSGCWLWGGTWQGDGYGLFWIKNFGTLNAHRASYMRFIGPIPQGLEVDHLCKVRCCVNPDHLELVTPAENKRRGDSIPGQNARKLFCKRGHPFAGENLKIEFLKGRAPRRVCVTCRREIEKQKYRRKQMASA